MKQVVIQSGQIHIEEVPEPLAREGEVLVRVHASAVSTGTEMSSTASSSASFIARLAAQPENLRRGWAMVKREGIKKTMQLVQGMVTNAYPIGYSAAGTVIGVGEGIEDVHRGDRVACAGAGIASHAEVISVPRNLVAIIPDAVSHRDAASTTIGAIALQGVRRANIALGEVVAVIGLGLIGQLTVQLLKNAGCRVVGIDIDPFRVDLARSLGCFLAVGADATTVSSILAATNGFGVDATIITAASDSPLLVKTSMEITRKKGRVVIVGSVPLTIDRSPCYEKEIDFLISCSYGPGRYDSTYERDGVDYPYAYVRWTENRNMMAYLSLLERKLIDCSLLINREFPIDQAIEAYTYLQEARPRPYSVVLTYTYSDNDNRYPPPVRAVKFSNIPKRDHRIGIGIIGAGGFLQGTHLPNLKRLSEYFDVRVVCDQSGLVASNVAKRFSVPEATTSIEEVLNSADIDCVMITTRHNSHADLARQALEYGKMVFVEKPVAIDEEQLGKLLTAVEHYQRPFMVGFNRRFAPAIQELHDAIKHIQSPVMITYRMDAGYLPSSHWVQTQEGGGRIVGEGCHIFDVFRFLIGCPPIQWSVTPIGSLGGMYSPHDNVSIAIRYQDGSVATLLYTSAGDASQGKEYCEAFVDGSTFVMSDYRQWSYRGKKRNATQQDKGHYEELRRFGQWIRDGAAEPIAWGEIVETTRLSLDIRDQIHKSATV